jgi:predicted nucleic acid-binding protein
MIVVDASVVIKLFKDEEGSETARDLFREMRTMERSFLAPTVLVYETLSAALHIEQPFEKVMLLLEQLRRFGLSIEEPTREELVAAESIAKTEAKSGGRPALFDSIYHAMAISRGGTFITADAKHIAKTGRYGAVMLLTDWKPEDRTTPPP